jgi:predicted phosphodiesterase
VLLTEQIGFNQLSIKRDEHFLKTLLTEVANVRSSNPHRISVSWKTVLVRMQAHFPSRELTIEGLRNRYRRLIDVKVNQITKRKDDYVSGKMSLEKRVLHEIRNKRPVAYVCERLDISEDKLFEVVAKLQYSGYRGVAVYDEDGVKFVHNRIRFFSTIPGLSGGEEGLDLSDIYGGERLTFAVVSDTHWGNKKTAKKELNKFYNLVESRGIDTVFHVGDLTDGYYTHRPTSVLEQEAVGYTNQLKLFVKEYPRREGITTYCITGNHDYTHMRNGFANIGEGIADLRDDIIYLGHNFGRLHLTDKVDVSLIHPTDGAGAGLSDKLRHLIDKNHNRRSKIMLVGHYHKTAHEKYNGVYAYMVPSFEKKTDFMDDNNLTTDVAGMIFTVMVDKKGDVISVHTEYYDYSS